MATFLYYADFQHYSYCENWIAAALDRNGHHCVRVQRTKWFDEDRLLAIARSVKAEYLLLSKTPEIVPGQLQYIRKHGVFVIFWTFDWMRCPTNWEWYGDIAREADICFQTDGYADQEFYTAENIRRVELHQGFVRGLHEIPNFSQESLSPRYSAAPYGSDIVFIGSTYTNRRRELMLEMTRYELPNSLGASQFTKYGAPQEQIWGRPFAATCYLSKIILGDNFTNEVAGYWSDRVYLTLACGGFFLTAYVQGMERKFENHRHLVWWKSFEELHELIRYYLPREAERRAIAHEGWRLVHQQDSYDRRIHQMTEFLRQPL